VDDEWRAPSPVDADLVCTRALWWFAVDLVHRGVAHPWSPSASVDELTRSLASGAGQPPIALDDFRMAEAALQAKVSGRPIEYWKEALDLLGRARPSDPAVARRLPFTSLRATLAGLDMQVADLSWRLDDIRDRNRVLVANTRVGLHERRAIEEELRVLGRNAMAAADRARSAERETETLTAQLCEERRRLQDERGRRREVEDALVRASCQLDVLRRSRWFPLFRLLAGRRLR